MNCREEMEFLEYFMNVRTFCIWGQGKTFGMGKIYTVTIYLLGLLPLAGAPKSRGEKNQVNCSVSGGRLYNISHFISMSSDFCFWHTEAPLFLPNCKSKSVRALCFSLRVLPSNINNKRGTMASEFNMDSSHALS
jgi:hypothetical protein